MKSGRVLAFRHVPFEGAGRMEPVVERRGMAIEYVDLFRPETTLPDTAAAAGLIFLGGPMSANDPLPYLEREIEVIRAAVERGQPVLGVCLGAQLMARALGQRVYRNAVKEIGWYPIHLTAEGARDPLFAGASPCETVFHWHGETFDLPRDAVRLASSDGCANQAVRFGARAYGLQFHLEVTPEMIADWCVEDENCGDVRELDGPIDAGCHAERLGELADSVFGFWCDLLHPTTTI